MTYRILIQLKRWGFSWLLLAFSILQSWGQVPLFERIGTRQGLSQSTIHTIYQSRRGFIWVGTRNGLNRFDGQTFQVFRRHPNQPKSLQSSDISSIYESANGTLWIGTITGGLYRMNTDGQTFTSISRTTRGLDISHCTINCLVEDDRHRIWAGTVENGWLVVDPSSNMISQIKLGSDSAKQPEVVTSLKDKDGSIWFGLNDGTLMHLGKGNHQWENTRLPLDNLPVKNSKIMALLRDSRGNLLVGTRNRGVFRFDEPTRQFDPVFNEPDTFERGNYVRAIAETADHSIWIGTDDGVRLLRQGNANDWLAIRPDPANKKSLSTHAIQCLLTDRQGNVWVGTWEGGLNVSFATQPLFNVVGVQSNSLRSLPSKVAALATDHTGALWVGSGRNLFRYTSDGQTRQPIVELSPVRNHDIHIMFTDRQGDVYVSYWNAGIVRYASSGNARLITPADWPVRHGLAFEQESGGKVWVVRGDNRLFLYDPYTNQMEDVAKSFNEKEAYKKLTINCLLEDRQGWLWIGTYTHGLIGWHRRSGRYRYFMADGKPGSLSENHIICLREDCRGTIWVGTSGGGLNSLDPKRGTFRVYTSDNGLAGDMVNSIESSPEGDLWIGTTEGLTRMTLPEGRMTSYNEADGLPTSEFVNLASTHLPTGTLAFGSTQGVVLLHPNRFNQRTLLPTAYLSDLRLFNRPVDVANPQSPAGTAISEVSQLTFDAKQTVFTLGFGALAFTQNRHMRYAYRLDGFEKDWNYVEQQQATTYTNLNPGQYTFRLKATLDGNRWGPEKQVRVTILPPWFKTDWAIALYMLILTSLVGLIHWIVRIREKLKADIHIEQIKAENIRQIDEAKTSFFTNISHELRTPLTLISSPLEKLLTGELPVTEQLYQQFRMMYRNTNRLLQLINQLLDLSKIESGALWPQVGQGDLIQHMDRIIHSFDELAASKQISLIITLDTGLSDSWFDADLVDKVVSNLLANALTYTPSGGIVTVDARKEQGKLLLTLTDTGVGIAADELPRIFERFYRAKDTKSSGTGVGLALTRQLVELVGGTIQVISKSGVGSCFTVMMPITADSFPPDWLTTQRVVESLSPIISPPALLSHPHPADTRPILLLAEDNEDLRQYLADCFSSAYQVLQAANGQQALLLAQQQLPDIVVTDWIMPELEGPELCALLKNDERTSHIPVVLLTSKSSQLSQLAGLDVGADDYITKPFSATLLEKRVQNLIENRRRLRLAYQQKDGLHATDLALTPIDKAFLQRAIHLVEEHIDNPNFDIDQLQDRLNMSQMQLYRKLKSLTNMPARDFIRHIRLERAAQLLSSGHANVSEAAYRVGFNDPSYFSRCFKKQFGHTPQEYASRQRATLNG